MSLVEIDVIHIIKYIPWPSLAVLVWIPDPNLAGLGSEIQTSSLVPVCKDHMHVNVYRNEISGTGL